jgi:hypothetical protein
MSKIQIADLLSGTELFQGNESFLTELQSVEASAIYGGGKKKNGSSKMGKSSSKSSSRNSSGKNSGRHTCPVIPDGGAD